MIMHSPPSAEREDLKDLKLRSIDYKFIAKNI